MKASDSLWGAVRTVDGYVQSVHVNDSRVPYFNLALGFLVVEYVFHTYLDIRQRKAVLTKDPPQELSEHYSADHVKQTRAYSIDKKNFGLVKGVADFIESLTVLSFMLLPAAWRWSEQVVHAVKPSWSGNEYVVSVAFALLTIVFETVKSMPWSLYNAFVIEERHGFNKQTLAIFFTDVLKSLALTFALAPPILSGVIYILRVSSAYMPLYLWAFVICLQLLAMAIYPTLIAPLFNKYEPLEQGTLRSGIEDLAGSLSFPLKKLFVVDGSKRSGHSNAYMYGFGKNKRIVLYDTLIKQCSEPQVVAVLAHELGHWKLGHTICLLVSQQAIMLAQFVLFAVFRSSDHLLEEFGFTGDTKPVIVSLTLFMMMIGPIDKLISWLFNLLSRRFEFQADNFAVKLKHSEPLTEALKVLDKENKSDFVVDRLYSQYHYSHPPMAERLRAIAESAKKAL